MASGGLPMEGLPDEVITQAEFARRMRVSPSSVRDAIRSNRIQATPGGFINWTTESEAWQENRDESKVRDGQDASLAAARREKEQWRARLLRLDYEKAAGKLVERETVRKSIERFARAARDAVLTIPDRVAAQQASAIADHFGELLRRHLPAETAARILAEMELPEISRITHEAWESESIAVLENLGRGPAEL